MDAIARRLDIHPRVAWQLEADLTVTDERAGWEQSSQLREQRRQRCVRGSRQAEWPQRLGQLVAGAGAVAIDSEVREEQTALPPRQLPLDPPAGHPRHEAPAELDPSSRFLPRHNAKLLPRLTRDNPGMAYVISCDCGYVSRGETEDELVEEAIRHIDEVHPEMAGAVSRDDLVAMAEEV